MESLKISLNEQQLILTAEHLFTALFQPGTNNYQKLAYELQREFKYGGSPEITRINFDRIKFDAATGEGSFRIVLDISFTFGCEDVRTDKPEQTSEWTFAINQTQKTIILNSSPFADSRSTADEF